MKIAIYLLSVLCLLTLSCSHHKPEVPPEPEEETLLLSVKNITFATEESGRVIEVASNTRWTATYDRVDWFWVITDDGFIGINLLPNYYSTDERTGKVLVTTVSGKITE